MRALLALCAAAPSGAAKTPHVVMIVADDLGHGDLGYTGTSEIKTPRIDEIAAKGRVLTDYYVQPSCSPTRASIHTGRYVMRYNVNMAFGKGPVGVPLNETFLPEVLKKAGYRTHAVGKWHLGDHAWEFTPTFRGYESYLGFLQGGQAYFTHLLPWFLPKPLKGQEKYDFRRQTSPNCGDGCSTVEVSADNHYTTHLFTAEAVTVIGAHDASEPLFLYLAYQAVHGPDQAPLSYVEPYLPDPAPATPTLRQVYGGMVAALDEGVGNVTAALKAAGLWESTFLVFTADNGGPTEMCMKQGSSNKPLRGGKCSIWEGGTRGAAFISGGALDSSVVGQPFSHLMHAVDWLPTIAAVAGVGSPATNLPLDGVNQYAGMSGSAAEAREEVFYGFSGGNRTGAAIRTRQWKLLKGEPYNGAPLPFPAVFTPNYTLTAPSAADTLAASSAVEGYVFDPVPEHLMARSAEQVLLFDISASIEENDADEVSAQHPDIVAQLGAKLDAYVAQAWTPEKGPDPALSPQCAQSQPKNKDGPDGESALTPYCKL